MKPKCSKELYCQFLIAAQTNFTATSFEEVCPKDIAHDAITRFLSRTKLTPKILWEYAKSLVDKQAGFLIIDDTVLDKWYGKKVGLARWQYSGTHHRVVHGIGLTTLLWTNRLPAKYSEHIPVDYRIYAPMEEGKTKNEHAREMLLLAHHRGLSPRYVLVDSWYSSLVNLKLIRTLNWKFLAWVRKDRIVVPQPHVKRHISELSIPKQGLVTHLRGFGEVKAFKLVTKKGDIDWLVTNDLSLTFPDIEKVAARRWRVEEYHRGLKQTTGVECCQARTPRSQRTHIFCCILSFLALEKRREETGESWYESKGRIIHEALFSYLKQPLVKLPVPTE